MHAQLALRAIPVAETAGTGGKRMLLLVVVHDKYDRR